MPQIRRFTKSFCATAVETEQVFPLSGRPPFQEAFVSMFATDASVTGLFPTRVEAT